MYMCVLFSDYNSNDFVTKQIGKIPVVIQNINVYGLERHNYTQLIDIKKAKN